MGLNLSGIVSFHGLGCFSKTQQDAHLRRGHTRIELSRRTHFTSIWLPGAIVLLFSYNSAIICTADTSKVGDYTPDLLRQLLSIRGALGVSFNGTKLSTDLVPNIPRSGHDSP